MSRPLRVEYPGAWYHVLNRGRRKEDIFFEDGDRKLFFKLLEEATRLYKLEVHAYTLMSNHYHLLVCTPEGNLSKIMRHINGKYTQIINKKYHYEGSVFKGRYKSILVQQQEYLLELVRYIHRNPLKAGIEKELGFHQWTSHRAYMKKRDRPKWLKVEQVVKQFGEYERAALKKMDQFVRQPTSKELEGQLDEGRWPSVLGCDAFKEHVKELLMGKKIEVEEVPDYREYEKQVSVEALLGEVALAYDMDPALIKKKRYPASMNIKRALIYICREDLQKGCREIGEALDGISRSAITRQYLAACRDWDEQKGCFENIKKARRCLERIKRSQQIKT